MVTTATIAKIYDVNGMRNFTAKIKNVDGKIIQKFDNFTLADMDTINTAGNSDKYDGDPNDRPSVIEIQGDIIGIDSSNMRLVLSDTPGQIIAKLANIKNTLIAFYTKSISL